MAALRKNKHPGPAPKCNAGFTLTEIAIVLCIIAVIIGAIMAAASTVYYRLRLNRGMDELGQIVNNMHSLYQAQNISYAALNPPATVNFTTYTSTLIQEGIFPSDMLSPVQTPGTPPCAGTVASNPWSSATGTCGGSTTGTVLLSLVGSSGKPVQFVVRFTGVPLSSCADLIIRTSQPGVDSTSGLTLPGSNGLSQICIGSTCYSGANLPLSGANANTMCSGAGPFSVDWYYNLGN
jgi:prepilin-type N-terminal cleavage/methylation domain-containing protein